MLHCFYTLIYHWVKKQIDLLVLAAAARGLFINYSSIILHEIILMKRHIAGEYSNHFMLYCALCKISLSFSHKCFKMHLSQRIFKAAAKNGNTNILKGQLGMGEKKWNDQSSIILLLKTQHTYSVGFVQI